MWSIELPVVGLPTVKTVVMQDSATEFVKIMGWSNGVALFVAKNPAPISPTRPLNPYAPWMQGTGYLVARDARTNQSLSIDCMDNALEVLMAYNVWKREFQHQCLFPGSAGHLVNNAERGLQAAAARTKFVAFGQGHDRA
jgi:hypothetical protein